MGGVKWNGFAVFKPDYLRDIPKRHRKSGSPQLRWENGVKWDVTIREG